MKLSRTHRFQTPVETRQAPSFVYNLLALYMPLTVIAALVFLAEAFLPLPSIFLLILACAGAFAASIYCDAKKTGNAAKPGQAAFPIRSGLAAMLVSYILASLFFQGFNREKWFLWKELFLPAIPTILAALETLYVWVSVVSLKRLFIARKRFETHIMASRGEQLQKALEQDSELLSYNGIEIIKTRNAYLIQLMIVGVVAFAAVFSEITLSLPLALLLIVMLASGILIWGLFGILRREYHHAGEGIVLSVSDRIKHILAMGVFSALAIAGAFVLSLNKSLLPFPWLSGFFSRIFGHVSNSPPAEEVEAPILVTPEQRFPFFDAIRDVVALPVRKGMPFIFLVIVIVGFILFLSFSMRARIKISGKEIPLYHGVGRTIMEWFKGLWFALSSFFGFYKKDKAQPEEPGKPSAEQIRRIREAILGAYSQAKKQEMQQSVTLFARLIIWGSEVRHILWKPAHGPGEYCGLLAASVLQETVQQTAMPQTARNAEIVRCGTLFEQALYSTEVLSAAERDEFRELVEGITGGA